MMTPAQCEELADHYKNLSQAEGITDFRQTALKNIARGFRGLAGQLDRLAAIGRDEARRSPQLAASFVRARPGD
jgi:hypothetical protein